MTGGVGGTGGTGTLGTRQLGIGFPSLVFNFIIYWVGLKLPSFLLVNVNETAFIIDKYRQLIVVQYVCK